MEEQLDYEALSSNAGLGANMLAGALVSCIFSVYKFSWRVSRLHPFSLPRRSKLCKKLIGCYYIAPVDSCRQAFQNTPSCFPLTASKSEVSTSL